MPKILWLHSDRGGCGAYRAYTPALQLQEEEQSYQTAMLLQAEMARQFDYLDGVDVLVIQRRASQLFKAWYLEAERRGIKTVFEMDDHLWAVPKHNPAREEWDRKETQRLLRWQLDHSDAILVSTVPLKQAVIEYGGQAPAKVHVAMNHLHPDVWAGTEGSKRYDNGDKIVIGYQGSMTHNIDFGTALPALARVLQHHPNVMLRFFGYVPPIIKDVIDLSRWQYAKGVMFDQYPQKLAYMNYTIGIAPLVDSKFNRAKSNIKFLEYSTLKVPSVCSNVYPYAQTVRHGDTGFLATTEQEWYDALTALVTDAKLRTDMGQRAYDDVWENWSPKKHIASWRNVFDALVPQGVLR